MTPYGTNADTLREKQINPENFTAYAKSMISKKSGLAVWIVSNCGSTKGAKQRLKLSDDLVNAGLHIERKGGCFKNNPAKRSDHDMIISDYKFYLSFENQIHCKDYITEKLWRNAYKNDAVPIVFGATKSDYEAIAPPRSFIYAEDYTPRELAEYIKYLDGNTTAYLEYFKWRTLQVEDMSMYGRQKGLCQICRILHGINIDNIFNPKYYDSYADIPLFGYPNRTRIVSSLKETFYGTENRECLPTY